MDLAEFDASILYNLFSPDLSEYIDINLKDHCWVIKGTENPDHQYKISSSILELPAREVNQCMQAKFIRWHDCNSIRVIDMSQTQKLEIIFELPDKPEIRKSGQGIQQKNMRSDIHERVKHIASSYMPFVEKTHYLSKETFDDQDDEGAAEAVTIKSTVGGNFFNYPFPL